MKLKKTQIMQREA